jgi:hypothetical protein
VSKSEKKEKAKMKRGTRIVEKVTLPTDPRKLEEFIRSATKRMRRQHIHVLRASNDIRTLRGVSRVFEDRANALQLLWRKEPSRALALMAELGIEIPQGWGGGAQ